MEEMIMNTCLVGYTGFVGSNLDEQFKFTNCYNSKNIEAAYGTNPDILVYAGVRAEKYIANKEPQKDYESIKEAFNNIKKINANKVVLISTIDVYKNPNEVDEDTTIDTNDLQPYGLNRYYLEQWVENEFEDTLIVRLPGLYGKNIKKNFIYDMIHVIPKLLTESKFKELLEMDESIEKYYVLQDNGFYSCNGSNEEEIKVLKEYFNKVNFSALNFTDSRGSFQFYNLENLWKDISIALNNKICKLNLANEPIRISEIFKYIKQKEFVNEIAPIVPNYNFKTKYAHYYGGENGYIGKKEDVLADIKLFVEGV